MAECSHNEQIVLCRINISLGRAGGGGEGAAGGWGGVELVRKICILLCNS